MATEAIVKRETAAIEVISPHSTLALAIEKGIEPATLGKMMDLQERWEANQARKLFVEAMAGFKSECPAVIGKDKRADFGAGKAKYSYATTGAIVTAITPALSKYGLSLSWETRQEQKLVTVTCHVTHAGGHRESATLTGPHDESGGKNPIQTLGSSVHYLQRYTLVSVLGLATADMDDPDNGPQTREVDPAVSARLANTCRPPAPPEHHDAPPPDQGPQSGEQVITGIVEDLSSKDGKKKDGSPFTRYGVKVNGNYYGTFSETFGKLAADLRDSGTPCRIVYTSDGKYFTIVSIEAINADGKLPL